MPENNNYNPEIAEKIRSGEYFKEAWDWYALKYIYPVTQRTIFLFISIGSLLITILSIYVFISFLPIKMKVPVVAVNQDMSLDYSRIIKLPVPEKTSPDLPVIQYLVQGYVTNWESYTYKNIPRQLTFLNTFSTDGLAKEIDRRYDIRNLNSPVLKYRDHTTRTITITNYSLERAKDFAVENNEQKDILVVDVPYRAIVQFTSEERNVLGVTTKQWVAEVNFTMSPIVYEKEKKAFRPLDFKVTAYRVTPI